MRFVGLGVERSLVVMVFTDLIQLPYLGDVLVIYLGLLGLISPIEHTACESVHTFTCPFVCAVVGIKIVEECLHPLTLSVTSAISPSASNNRSAACHPLSIS